MSQSWEPIERGLEIQEAWKPGNLEVWRLGGLEASNRAAMRQSWEPIERDLEIQEAWKPRNLEVWRLGGLEAGKTGGLEARRPGGLQQTTYEVILGAYRKRFGNPGGLETTEPRSLEARIDVGARVPMRHPRTL